MFAYTHILRICVKICQQDCYPYPNHVPFANHFNAVSILGIAWIYSLVIWTGYLLFSCSGHTLHCTGLIYRLNFTREEEFNSQLCTSLFIAMQYPKLFFFVVLRNCHCLDSEQDGEKIFCWYCLWRNNEYTFENIPLILTSGKNKFIPYPSSKAGKRKKHVELQNWRRFSNVME